jgi:hypothetical protein
MEYDDAEVKPGRHDGFRSSVSSSSAVTALFRCRHPVTPTGIAR